jgi:antitoxin component YwqK of YwqJK toxin-antitoxin module
MFTLATDVQKIIMEFLEPQEIKVLYETCTFSKVMFEELTKHTNYIVSCNRIILDKEIKWFELKNIKLKLLETYKNINGNQWWFKNGKRHRDNDLPAVIFPNGAQYWYQNGEIHRDNDLPAIIKANGNQYWYKNGLKHRDNDLPAIIRTDGTQEWYKNGQRYFPY